jgi:hypothetical protein
MATDGSFTILGAYKVGGSHITQPTGQIRDSPRESRMAPGMSYPVVKHRPHLQYRLSEGSAPVGKHQTFKINSVGRRLGAIHQLIGDAVEAHCQLGNRTNHSSIILCSL